MVKRVVWRRTLHRKSAENDDQVVYREEIALPVACRCSLLVDLFFSSELTLRKNLLPAHLCRTGCAFCIGNESMHERGSLRTKKAEKQNFNSVTSKIYTMVRH
jgi:hypothetical protein